MSPRPLSYQIFVQHAQLEVGEEVRRGEVDGLLVAGESHLVLPLALVSTSKPAEDLAAGWVHLQTSRGRVVVGSGSSNQMGSHTQLDSEVWPTCPRRMQAGRTSSVVVWEFRQSCYTS